MVERSELSDVVDDLLVLSPTHGVEPLDVELKIGSLVVETILKNLPEEVRVQAVGVDEVVK
jgi:hypothetical protein